MTKSDFVKIAASGSNAPLIAAAADDDDSQRFHQTADDSCQLIDKLNERQLMNHTFQCLLSLLRIQSRDGLSNSNKARLFRTAVNQLIEASASEDGCLLLSGSTQHSDGHIPSINAVVESKVRSEPNASSINQARGTGAMEKIVQLTQMSMIVLSSENVSEVLADAILQLITERSESRALRTIPVGNQIAGMNNLYAVHLLRLLHKVNPTFATEVDEAGRCPLHCAAETSESVEVIEYLLCLNPNAVNMQTTASKSTPLHILASRDLFLTQTLMIRPLVIPDGCRDSLSLEDTLGKLPLHIACGKRDVSIGIVRLLLCYCPNSAWKADNQQCYPLHHLSTWRPPASEVDEVSDMISFLMSLYPDAVQQKDVRGFLPLHLASAVGCLSIVQRIYSAYPAAIEVTTVGNQTALHSAALPHSISDFLIADHLELPTLEFLHSQYPDAATRSIIFDYTLLHLVLMYDLETVQLVYSWHPEAIAVMDDFGMLPLHYLIQEYSDKQDSLDILRFLLRHYPAGASVRNKRGETPSEILHALREDGDVVDPAFERLLLRAAPKDNVDRLRDLNWQFRRGAMFQLFSSSAISQADSLEAGVSTTSSCGDIAASVASLHPTAASVQTSDASPPSTSFPSSSAVDLSRGLIVWSLLRANGSVELQRTVVSFL
jgi:ankyrin repeat protein